MQSRRYKVDLSAYMAECEANYLRLMKLLPKNDNQVIYNVQLPNNRKGLIYFRIIERCKYTTMLTVEQEGFAEWLAPSHFDVRIYHDARMVEVTAFQRQQRIQPVYTYPNQKMYQKDEKYQQHRFLSECLINCLENGLSLVEYQIA